MSLSKNLSIIFLLNVFTQVSVGFVAIYSLPIIFNNLGAYDFGLYSFLNIILSTAILFDFGIGKATIYSIARNINSKETIKHIIKSSTFITTIISTVLSTTIYLVIYCGNFDSISSLKYNKALNLYIASIPIVLFTGLFKNIFEGLNNLIYSLIYRYILNLSIYIVPLLLCKYSHGITYILSYMLYFRLFIILGAAFIIIKIISKNENSTISQSAFKLKEFFIFASWSSITNLLTPLLVQLDKFLIIAFLSFKALSFYTLPMEIINGFLIVPSAIASITFPRFCSSSISFQEKTSTLLNFIRYLFLFLFPIVSLSSISSKDILFLWQGIELSKNSSVVFSVLLIASTILSFGWLISNLLIGIGRVDIPSKVFLIEVPIYIALSILLVSIKGINGLAFAVLARAFIEVSCYSYYLIKISQIKFNLKKLLPFIYFTFSVLFILTSIGFLNKIEIKIISYSIAILFIYIYEYIAFITSAEKKFLNFRYN